MTWVGPGIIAFIVAAVLFMAYRAGKKSERADAATDMLKDINDALRPPTDDELKLVRDKYKRN